MQALAGLSLVECYLGERRPALHTLGAGGNKDSITTKHNMIAVVCGRNSDGYIDTEC